MKTILLFCTVSFWACLNVKCQTSEQYLNVMKKNVSTLDTAQRSETFKNLLHSFERVIKIEKAQWIPLYYAAMCAGALASQERNNNIAEEFTDKAAAYLAIADSISPKNSEIYVMKAQIAFIQIKVDVMERGLKNSMIAAKFLEDAIKLDNQNPRAFLLIGVGKYSMPEQVGGNKKVACEYFSKAEELLNKHPKNDIEPRWGHEETTSLLKKCNKLFPTKSENPTSGK
jgi:hypothetical protein